MWRMIVLRTGWWLIVLVACSTTASAVLGYAKGYALAWATDQPTDGSASFQVYSAITSGGRFAFIKWTEKPNSSRPLPPRFALRTDEGPLREALSDVFTGPRSSGFLGFRYTQLNVLGNTIAGFVVPAWVVVALLWSAVVGIPLYRRRQHRLRRAPAFEVLQSSSS
jgi:hypothetical protein